MATLGIYVATYRDIAGVQMSSTVHPKWVAAMRALLGLICFILRPSNWGRPKQAAWVPRECVELYSFIATRYFQVRFPHCNSASCMVDRLFPLRAFILPQVFLIIDQRKYQ